MRIAMIGHKRIPTREGGVEVVVEELSTRMAKSGHTIHVYNRGGRKKAAKTLEPVRLKEFRGVRILTIPTINVKSLDAFVYSFFATVRAIFGNYDVIHYHAEGPCVMLRLAQLFRKKTIATIHGLDWQRAKWNGFATKYLLLGEKMAAKYADEVIVLSKNIEAYFMETYGRKTRYIPNGVTLPVFREPNIIASRFGLSKNGYILFLARIVPEKGLHYLLEAYRQIDTGIRLVIAGGSSHSDDYVEQITRMAAQDQRVIMTGFVQGDELAELYSNCLVYVLPSELEGMPISLLEAMSYGCRCLVSDIPENTEIFGEMTEHFRSSDVKSLRAKLENILGDEPRRLTEVAEKIISLHSWEAVADQTLKVYEEVTAKGKSG